jgi:uncharacterized membrane protein HdeD (DUF308 family)
MNAAVAQQPRQMPWWILLVQGIAAIILGVLFFTNPAATSIIVVRFIAIYWLITGIISLVRIFTDPHHRIWKLISGIIGIFAGWFLLTSPGLESAAIFGVTVVLLLAIQGIIMGIAELIEAFQGGGWGPGIIGVISIVIGIILLSQPLLTAAVLPWVIGSFAFVGGIFAIVMAFRLKGAQG